MSQVAIVKAIYYYNGNGVMLLMMVPEILRKRQSTGKVLIMLSQIRAAQGPELRQNSFRIFVEVNT